MCRIKTLVRVLSLRPATGSPPSSPTTDNDGRAPPFDCRTTDSGGSGVSYAHQKTTPCVTDTRRLDQSKPRLSSGHTNS
jgi:hypothetical protein